jgi:hypothetical protein
MGIIRTCKSLSSIRTRESRIIFVPDDFKLKAGKPDALVFPLGDTRYEWQRTCVALGIGQFRCRKCGATEKCSHLARHRSYVGPLLRHTRHTAVRNFDDAGMPRDRAKAITGHVTDSVYTRYNIGKEKDVDEARLLAE